MLALSPSTITSRRLRNSSSMARAPLWSPVSASIPACCVKDAVHEVARIAADVGAGELHVGRDDDTADLGIDDAGDGDADGGQGAALQALVAEQGIDDVAALKAELAAMSARLGSLEKIRTEES